MKKFLGSLICIVAISFTICLLYGQEAQPHAQGKELPTYAQFQAEQVAVRAVAYGGTGSSTSTGSGAVVRSSTPTMTNAIVVGYQTLVDAASITNDVSVSSAAQVVLEGNRTLLAPSNGKDGQRITIDVIQDSVGNRTLTFATNYVFGSTVTSPTITTNSFQRDIITAVCRSTNNVWRVVSVSQGYN